MTQKIFEDSFTKFNIVYSETIKKLEKTMKVTVNLLTTYKLGLPDLYLFKKNTHTFIKR